MSLAANFPVKPASREQSKNMDFSNSKVDTKMNYINVEEFEAEKYFETSKVDNSGTENKSCFIERNLDPSKVIKEEINNMDILDPQSDKKLKDRKLEEIEAQKVSESSKVDNRKTKNSPPSIERNTNSPSKKQTPNTKKGKKKGGKNRLLENQRQHWDTLRKIHTKSDQHIDHVDSVDWEALRNAKPYEVAKTIEFCDQQHLITKNVRI